MELDKIFEKCFSEIGGEDNVDVRWYLKERPKDVSRKNFFEQAVFAIWEAGKSRKAVEAFLKRAEENGFSWDFATVSSCDGQHLLGFMEKLHGRPVPKGARKRWEAVHNIAKDIKTYPTEADFHKSFFNGKVKSADLDKNDAERLMNRGFPFIGEANANYILRNMGGEFIKCDRWMDAFLRYYKIHLDDLEKRIQTLNIPLGLFDVVIWAYCEKFVGKINEFNKHFKRVFA